MPAVEPAAQRRPAGRAACGCPGRFVPRGEKGLCVSREAGGRAHCSSPEAQVGGREERRQNEETVSPIQHSGFVRVGLRVCSWEAKMIISVDV